MYHQLIATVSPPPAMPSASDAAVFLLFSLSNPRTFEPTLPSRHTLSPDMYPELAPNPRHELRNKHVS